ncbi:MAG TPA: DNA/RNA non-specific endonuclease [Virgibacillus sp.]|nr:DNA/RNA non-specific endonuclease [Virgibacillus sp.]
MQKQLRVPKRTKMWQCDHAGHLAGDRFRGSPELDNLASQSSAVNLSEYKRIENEWAQAIDEDKSVL